MIMTPLEDGAVKGIIVGEVYTSLVGQDTGLYLPVGESGAEGKGDIFVHGSEGLENKQICCRRRFNVVGECNINDVDEQGRGKEGDSFIVVVS